MSGPKVELDVKYEAGHSYREEWEPTDLFCPHCGQDAVWVNAGAGDYYEGPQHLCVICVHTFSMPRLHPAKGWQDEQRLHAIRWRLSGPEVLDAYPS